MPAKFEARIRQPHTADITAYVEANNEHDAKTLFEQQYGRDNVNFVKEIAYSNTDGHSSYDGLSDGFSDDRKMLAPLVALCVAGWLAYQGYTTFIQPLFSGENKAPPASITQAEVSAPTYDAGELDSRADVLPTEVQDSNPVESPTTAQPPEVATDQNNQIDAAALPTAPAVRPQLIKFEVMVRRGKSYETITISAKDKNDARRIVRDFRGNPEILELNHDVSGSER